VLGKNRRRPPVELTPRALGAAGTTSKDGGPAMIALTDDQMTAVMDAARHVQRPLRDQFLRTIAAALEGKKDFGDGDVNRAIQTAVRVSRNIGAA
jgi:hypothetical protein